MPAAFAPPPAPPADQPRILLYDIETMAKLAWVWEDRNTNIIDTYRDWYMLSAAWRWYPSRHTGFVSIFQDPAFTPGCRNDLLVAATLASLFDQADVTVAHYGDGYDLPKTQARIEYHRLPIPSPHQHLDTKKEAARYFKNYSNRLDELCRVLDIGRKLQHRGFEMWRGCEDGDPRAWREMERYNRHDVALLDGLYRRLIPWIGTPGYGGAGPNYGLWPQGNHDWTCPKCGGHRGQMRGVYRTRFSQFQRFQCQSCGGYSRAPFRERGHAPAI
jgi:hypothetical protein